MKELFNKLTKTELSTAKNLTLIDTCFFISTFGNNHLKEFREIKNKALTSFNVEELVHVEHRLHHHKHEIRKFLKNTDLIILNVPVSPGQRQKEMDFINSIDPDLLKHSHDPSDLVLLAAAIKTHSIVLTKDKHDLFNTELENYVKKYNIKIKKELKDV